METIFMGENILEFIHTFSSDERCAEFIAQEKCKKGYKCKHCSNEKYFEVNNNHSRECTKCKYIESCTAGTFFHKLKFGLQKSFMIMFEMGCTTAKGMSSIQMSKRYGMRQKIVWLFMQKVKTAMVSSKTQPMVGDVQADEFVIGGKETGYM